MKIVTAEQMRALDKSASDEYGVPSIVLMENAGIRSFDLIYDTLCQIGGTQVAIVCGRGNNGGDGFVVARHLHQAGADVNVLLVGTVVDVKGDAAVNLQIALKSGISVTEVFDIEPVQKVLSDADLVIDALFGTGIKGEITGLAGEVIDEINASGKPVVAIDLPSGLDADTGQILGRCVKADQTITFALPKIGLVTYPGASYAGDVSVADIGIPELAFDNSEISTFLTEELDVNAILPDRPRDGYKGTFGHVAVIAGSVGLTGAAAMSSMAAVRIGAGLVTLGIPSSLNDVLESKVTEVMTVPLPETSDRSFSTDAIETALELIEKCDVVAIGPGLGQHRDTVEFVKKLIPQIDCPMVIDADALNSIAKDTSILKNLKQPAIITPHPGEMSRLSGTPTQTIQSNRLKAAIDAAERFGIVVVLKGAATVIASPDGEAWINPTGSPALASGGTGDILTGSIVGLLAQGLSPMDAAVAGVYIHGRAGEIAEERSGKCGTAATDLLSLLPLAIDQIRKGSR